MKKYTHVFYFLKKYLIFFLLLISMYSVSLWSWSLSGDDLYSLTEAPTSISEFAQSLPPTDQQYRPLTYLLFNLYKPLLPNFRMIFFVNVALLAVVPTLTYFLMKKLLSSSAALYLTTAMMLSATFFYHVFTISALANTLMMIIFLVMLQLKGKKTVIWAAILFLASVMIKESFFAHFLVFILIVTQSSLQRNSKIVVIITAFTGIGVYLYSRATHFSVIGENYKLVITPSKLKENILLFIPWLLQYPRGWQYGFPFPLPLLQKVGIMLFSALAMVSGIGVLWKRNLQGITYIVLMGMSLLPYFFLNRVLVYYVDIAQILVFLFIALFLSSLQKKHPHWVNSIIFGVLVLAISLNVTVLPIWEKYSFVGVANETAQNFTRRLKETNATQYRNICIFNHSEGIWATENGLLAKKLGYTFTIYSFYEPESDRCPTDSLKLINRSRSYF